MTQHLWRIMRTCIIHTNIQHVIREKIKVSRKKNMNLSCMTRQKKITNIFRRKMHTHSKSTFPTQNTDSSNIIPSPPPKQDNKENNKNEWYAFIAGMTTSYFSVFSGIIIGNFIKS
jgi:hypothetical protein